jgi:hypothetical protein
MTNQALFKIVLLWVVIWLVTWLVTWLCSRRSRDRAREHGYASMPSRGLMSPLRDTFFSLARAGTALGRFGQKAWSKLASRASLVLSPAPVLLGVSVPHRLEAGATFAIRFVAYVERVEALVGRQLAALGGDESDAALGITPERKARWEVGTPVTVRIEAGPHIELRFHEASFEWNGEYNIISFSGTVAPDAQAGRSTQLCLEALIEGIPIAFIPIDLKIARGVGGDSTRFLTSQPAQTAFASYSRKDANDVSLCLSALAHWDSGLKVFMDCLDMTPNAHWRHELEGIVP